MKGVPLECFPYACSPLWSCPVHAATAAEMAAADWPEPEYGWAEWDRLSEAGRAEAIAERDKVRS